MRRILPLFLLLLCVAPAPADEAAVKKLLKDLEATYKPTSIIRGGEPAPDTFLKTVSFQISGDTFTPRFEMKGKTESKDAVITLDPSKTPIAIDLTPKEGPDANKPIRGILKVEKDTVTLCWADAGEKVERPKEFTSTKENKHFLIIMKKDNRRIDVKTQNSHAPLARPGYMMTTAPTDATASANTDRRAPEE